MEPTAGEAIVGGKPATARAGGVGFVPQFDVVYQDLTVRAHLLLYARLRGARREVIRGLVQHVAEMVDLDGDAFDQPARNLSGGMRRRLSLGLALVGNPGVLFCDEPTTGLDPDARRGVWAIIERAKKGRSVILTTHSMEESDTLCTRVAVVAASRLQVVGTPLHLKTHFGSGFKLSVNLVDAANAGSLLVFLREHCDMVESEESYGATRSFRVAPRGGSVAGLFEALDRHVRRLGVTDFALAQPSLEDAFLNIVAATDTEGKGSREGEAGVDVPSGSM